MTQSTQMVAATQVNRQFILEMRGFTDTEKKMLESTFRLTSRREFSYLEPREGHQRPDIYLINADNAEQVESLVRQEIGVPNLFAPAVLIGRQAVETRWPFIAKPIHWMRLFEKLDEMMEVALQERDKRTQRKPEAWDGKTFRRQSDQHRVVAVEPQVMLKRETVMVVDDSATVRAFMKIKLSPFNFDVDFAESGEEAVQKARRKPYTCIFLDIMMPGIDGYEVCKRIKGNSSTKKTAVVMLTSKSSMIDKLRANWSGCDAFLSKPVAEDDLLSTIAKYLPSAKESLKE